MSSEGQKIRRGNGGDPDPCPPPGAEEWTVYDIHDRYGLDKKRPRAIGCNPYMRDAGTIDLIALIKQNASHIAHPAVITAIQRWERFVLNRHLLREGEELYKLAKAHLKRISAALLEGAEERASTTNDAFIYFENGKLVQEQLECLRLAWVLLANDDDVKRARKRNGFPAQLPLLKDKLTSALSEKAAQEYQDHQERRKGEGYPFKDGKEDEEIWRKSRTWPVIEVSAFLESVAGAKFLERRRSWDAMRSAFVVWRFSKSPDAIKKHRQRAKNRPR